MIPFFNEIPKVVKVIGIECRRLGARGWGRADVELVFHGPWLHKM